MQTVLILFIMAAYITRDHSDTFYILVQRRGEIEAIGVEVTYGFGATGANHSGPIQQHAG